MIFKKNIKTGKTFFYNSVMPDSLAKKLEQWKASETKTKELKANFVKEFWKWRGID